MARVDGGMIRVALERREEVDGYYWLYFNDPKKTILVLAMDESLLPKIGTKMYMEYPDEGTVIIHWPINGKFHKWKYKRGEMGGQFCL